MSARRHPLPPGPASPHHPGAGPATRRSRRERRARRTRRVAITVVLVVVTGAGLAWFGWFSRWWLNADGAGYLATGRNLVRGHGLRAPDGEPLSWWYRPLYPMWLTAPWVLRESFTASIWMSRLALVAAAPVAAAATWRFVGRPGPALVAGLAAVAHPVTLLAGGANFVPDGMVATALLVAAVAATVGADRPRIRRGWLAAAVIAVAAAAAAKETGILGLPLVAVLVWAGRRRPAPAAVVAAFAALGVGVFGALLAVAGPLVVPVRALPGLLRRGLSLQVTTNGPLRAAGVALLVVLVVWAARHAGDALPRTGLALMAVGLPQAVYATGAGLGLRNGATVPVGAALVAGALAGRWSVARSSVRRAVAALTAVSVPVWGTAAGITHPSRLGDVSIRSWDNPMTRRATAWLARHTEGQAVGCTVIFCGALWLLGDGALELRLLPQSAARAGPTRLGDLRFTLRSGWRGPRRGSPICGGPMLMLTKSDERFGTVFECDLLRSVRRQKLRHLVVTEGPSGNTHDAARLVPYLERHPSFRRVYESRPEDWPRVLAVYEVLAPPSPLERPRLVLSPPARYALRGSDLPRPMITVDAVCLYDLVRRAFSTPTGPGTGRASERAWAAAPSAGCTRR